MVDEGWASPDSLLGTLQRGRGTGYREALTTPGAESLVLRCVTHDPRWDRQVDERGDYYARLVVELGIPVHAIPFDLEDPELTFGLTFDVLVALSRSGSTVAAATLHTYVTQVEEPEWWVIGHLWREAGPLARRGLLELVLDRIDDQGLAGAVTLHEDGPWCAWSDHPRVAAALATPEPQRPRSGCPDVSDRTNPELRALADAPSSRLRTAAFRELGRRSDVVLLDLAERSDLRNSAGVTASLAGPLKDLGAAALTRARAWVGCDDEWLRGLGREIIAAHGSPDDAPEVLAWFDEAAAEGAWCVTESLADGLARLDHQPAAPAIARAWESTPHSLARRCYLPALIQLRPPALQGYVDEAADDCESDVRDLARTHRERSA